MKGEVVSMEARAVVGKVRAKRRVRCVDGECGVVAGGKWRNRTRGAFIGGGGTRTKVDCMVTKRVGCPR